MDFIDLIFLLLSLCLITLPVLSTLCLFKPNTSFRTALFIAATASIPVLYFIDVTLWAQNVYAFTWIDGIGLKFDLISYVDLIDLPDQALTVSNILFHYCIFLLLSIGLYFLVMRLKKNQWFQSIFAIPALFFSFTLLSLLYISPLGALSIETVLYLLGCTAHFLAASAFWILSYTNTGRASLLVRAAN